MKKFIALLLTLLLALSAAAPALAENRHIAPCTAAK